MIPSRDAIAESQSASHMGLSAAKSQVSSHGVCSWMNASPLVSSTALLAVEGC